MITTTSGYCCDDNQRGSECVSSKSGYHCWHSPVSNNGIYWSTVAPDPVCCHCGVKESSTHGPYHPLNKPLWNGTITGGSIGTGTITVTNPTWVTNPASTTVVWDGNGGYYNGGITYTIPSNGSWIPVSTSGFSQSVPTAKTCTCDGINTGCSNCTKL